MKVSQLMTRKLISLGPDDSVERAVQLLRQRGVRHLLVMEDSEVVGILSDRDLKRAMDPGRSKKRKMMNLGGLFFLLEPILVREIMTRDVVSIEPHLSAQEAARIMVTMRFGALPVVRNGQTVGIITETDLLRYFAETDSPDQYKRKIRPARKKSRVR